MTSWRRNSRRCATSTPSMTRKSNRCGTILTSPLGEGPTPLALTKRHGEIRGPKARIIPAWGNASCFCDHKSMSANGEVHSPAVTTKIGSREEKEIKAGSGNGLSALGGHASRFLGSCPRNYPTAKQCLRTRTGRLIIILVAVAWRPSSCSTDR